MIVSNKSRGVTWFIKTILYVTLFFITFSGRVSARDLVVGVGFIPQTILIQVYL